MLIDTCTATLILLGAAISGLAQERPDFSGEWILNRQVSTLSRAQTECRAVSGESNAASQRFATRRRL